MASNKVRAALFDVDGTLVDTNYLHAVTWWQAFAQAGHEVAGRPTEGERPGAIPASRFVRYFFSARTSANTLDATSIASRAVGAPQ